MIVNRANELFERDKHRIEKNLSRLKKIHGPTKGIVRTIIDGVLVDDCIENLVVSRGREYVAQRLFEAKHPSSPRFWDHKISHFSVGSGGSVIVGGFVNLLGPDICDRDLYEPIPLSGNPGDPLYLQSPGDMVRGVESTAYVVKPIEPSGTIDIIQTQDINCSAGPVYSYVRCVCVKSIGEPNYLLNDDDYIHINESCLYFCLGTDAQCYAHICFPPKYVEKKSELVVEWYVLC